MSAAELTPGQLARRRALRAVIAGQVFVHASGTGLRMALPLMLLREGGILGLRGELAAGLLVSLFALLPALIALPVGRWVDRRGYHRPVAVAVGLGMLGGLLAVPAGLMAPGEVLLGLSNGTADGVFWQGARALLLLICAVSLGTSVNLGIICIQRTAGRLATHVEEDEALLAPEQAEARRLARNDELKRVFSWLGLAPSVSNVIGPMLAGICIDAFGFPIAFALLSVLPLATLLLAKRVPREQIRTASPTARAARVRGWAGIRELLMLPSMRRLLLINWLFSASWDLFNFLVPLHGQALSLPASAIGGVLSTFALSVAGVRLLLPALAHRLQERQVISGAFCVVALGFGLFPLAHTALGMMAFAVLVGLGLGATQPMVMAMLHHITPPERQGESLGLRSACINLSGAVLPLCFGALGAALGAALLFRGMAALLLAGARLPLALRSADTHGG